MEIVEATKDDNQVLKNLMSMYLHDMSEYADFLRLSVDGSYKYQNLGYYLEKEELSAFFIKIDSEIAGFILSNRRPYIPDDCDISIQEFFILRKYRKKGLGSRVASLFFKKFPGKYFVAQLIGNKPAIRFWRSVYKQLGLEFEEREEINSGVRVITQRFTI